VARISFMSSLITQDPEILGGEPVFLGTRVPVKSLFDHLEAGDSIDEFLKGFPTVQREQVIALLEEAREHAIRPRPNSARKRTKFPIFPSGSPGTLELTGNDLVRLEAEEDARLHGRPA
jgi:uncharacterized protein (DUF433 family)